MVDPVKFFLFRLTQTEKKTRLTVSVGEPASQTNNSYSADGITITINHSLSLQLPVSARLSGRVVRHVLVTD